MAHGSTVRLVTMTSQMDESLSQPPQATSVAAKGTVVVNFISPSAFLGLDETHRSTTNGYKSYFLILFGSLCAIFLGTLLGCAVSDYNMFLNTDGFAVWEKPFEGHEAFILQKGITLEELQVFDRVGKQQVFKECHGERPPAERSC